MTIDGSTSSPSSANQAPQDQPEPEPRPAAVLHVLKQGDTFLVADSFGDVYGGEDGLFHNDTRVLSYLRLSLGNKPPCALSATVTHDNVFFTAHMTNRPLPPLGGRSIPEGVIHLERQRLIWEDRVFERLRLTNFGTSKVALPITLQFGADFRDMFEVRGSDRPVRGILAPPRVEQEQIHLHYTGLDGIERSCWIAFSHSPVHLTGGQADWLVDIDERQPVEIFVEIGITPSPPPSAARYREASLKAKWANRKKLTRGARAIASHRLFNEWLSRSQSDLALLTTQLPTGPYPYAGIPWFSTPFGRDAVITALQTLWLDPGLARGVLAFLAKHQAHETSTFADSAPGKIMHETRKGEMTALGELPFRQYYGGVDTTPLFVVLAGAYAHRTGDQAFIDQLWPALTAAMDWVQGPGDSNGDGFLDYARGEASGLSNQGWKDSSDSIFHANGDFPEGPIALVEVQGYVYAAYRSMSAMAAHRGDDAASEQWQAKAEKLRLAVEEKFWMPEAGFYGVALDGKGQLCRVKTSNPGHLLWSGLPSQERAALVTEQLLAAHFNSGWGVRTLADTEIRFNPMSYHNGSVWPHDNAICVAGISLYGDRAGASSLLQQAFSSAVHFRMRLPELFCGFPRYNGEQPIPYPVACLPQAWAAGSPFMLLQACLGLSINGWNNYIEIDHPELPPDLDRLVVRRLPIGDRRVDLVFERSGPRVAVYMQGKDAAHINIHLRG